MATLRDIASINTNEERGKRTVRKRCVNENLFRERNIKGTIAGRAASSVPPASYIFTLVEPKPETQWSDLIWTFGKENKEEENIVNSSVWKWRKKFKKKKMPVFILALPTTKAVINEKF